MNPHRKTKIVATIGPASGSRDMLGRLIAEGMDVARLNFSHGVHSDHAVRLRTIRSLARAAGRTVAVMGDLQGPKMRIGTLPGEGIELREGEEVVLATNERIYRGGAIPLPSPIFAAGTRAGAGVLLDDGTLALEIISARKPLFRARVTRGGRLLSNKGVNVPRLELRRSLLEAKDRADIVFGLREGVDYLALSFLRNAKDVHAARRFIGRTPVRLVAKIERPEALEHLDEILAEVDAIMIARGDLGIETPLWELPVYQKEIVERARRAMRPVIVATQMLDSMIRSPLPTRAEVSDVANAVYDSADAVMLSAETASGKYPIESVRMMRRVLEATERKVSPAELQGTNPDSVAASVAKSAKYIAAEVGAVCIAAGTTTGRSALAVSHFRPKTPIIAVAHDERAARSLALAWGVSPIVIRAARSSEAFALATLKALRGHGVRRGERIVFVFGTSVGQPGSTNATQVITA